MEVKKRLIDIGMQQIELAKKLMARESYISEALNGKRKVPDMRKNSICYWGGKIVRTIKNNKYVTFGEYQTAGLTWGDFETNNFTFGDIANREKIKELIKIKNETLNK